VGAKCTRVYHHHEYDEATDAKTRMIQDVNSALFEECPWTTPPGGGKNLVTDYENDDLGRRLRTIKPWIVVDPQQCVRRANRGWRSGQSTTAFTGMRIIQVWKAQGYMTGPGPGSWHILGPVSVSVRNADDVERDQIQASACCSCGPLGVDTFGGSGQLAAQCDWTRWAHNELDLWGRVLELRVYHTIPLNGEGFPTANYDATDTAFDSMNRVVRTQSPGGTITRTVYDLVGRRTASWVGTNDAGATNNDPSGGGTAGNNMKAVWRGVYDDGASNGDGNLTEERWPVDSNSMHDKLTVYEYDYRDRRKAAYSNNVTTDVVLTTVYDNLDRVIENARYNNDDSEENRTHLQQHGVRQQGPRV